MKTLSFLFPFSSTQRWLALVMSLLALTALTQVVYAGIWGSPVIVDTGLGNVGSYTSVAVVNGNPAISYRDQFSGNLKYVRATDANGTAWGTPLTLDSTGNVGEYTSLAVVNGNPAISYYDASNSDLKYVRATDADGTAWGTPLMLDSTGAAGSYTSLAVVNGNPAISYYDYTNSNVRYVRATNADGTTWGTPVAIDVSASNVGYFTSLAVINGNPAISYYDFTNSNVRYVRATNVNGTTWGTPVAIDISTSAVGHYTSLAVVNGNPAISYYDLTNSNVRYVRATNANGTTWGTPIAIDVSTAVVGEYTSLEVVNGNPAISYYDNSNGNLKYVRATNANGTTWGTPITLDSTGSVGQYTSLVVVSGNPAISYFDASNGDLKYERANDANGTMWGGGQLVDPGSGQGGQYTSLAVINGNPAISYHDPAPGAQDLLFVRATDANGTTWGTPLTLDSTGAVGSYTSLAVVNGNPAISYFDTSNGDLKYVRATDADGTAWDTPLTLDSTGIVGEYTSLAVVNGNPAISYFDATNGDLKYVRATDADGTAWDTPLTLDSTGIVGEYTSLTVVNGNPAISYFDNANSNVRYVRATNADGTTWGTPIAIDVSASSVGQHTSLAMVNGNPAISYYDNSNGNLKYVRAIDADGTTWGIPLTLDSTGVVGLYTSLVVVSGNPAISYYDNNNGNLKYVRATDVSGTAWDIPGILDGDDGSNVGAFGSMAVVNGNPAVSYFGSLRYVRSPNPTAITVQNVGRVVEQPVAMWGGVVLLLLLTRAVLSTRRCLAR